MRIFCPVLKRIFFDNGASVTCKVKKCKMTGAVSCSLNCVEGSHEPIFLPCGQEVTLGRQIETKILDKRCSRRQVIFLADEKSMEVKVRQVGPNSSGANGLALIQGQTYTLKHGDHVEFLLGQYVHKIEFDPAPTLDVYENGRKRPPDGNYQTPSKRPRAQFEECDETEGKPCPGTKVEMIDGDKLMVITTKGVEARSKIAAYDIDGTVIVTKSGRVFPKDIDDWMIAFPEVPGKLKSLWNLGYKVVFFTNQAGISRGKLRIEDFKNKTLKIIQKVGIPVQVFVSTGKGIYRKPAPGMWNELVNEKNDGVIVHKDDCFYVGDAAGRPVNWAPKKKKDFSVSDRLFALNLGLKFFTPEEHFKGQKPVTFSLPAFDPSKLSSETALLHPRDSQLCLGEQEVVVLVGFPGSGKSYFAKNHLIPKGYRHVNRDTLGSWQRCISALESSLREGKSVVVDNTNPDSESRKKFLDVAKKFGVSCRCFRLVTTVEHARHNNRFREMTDDSHETVSEAIINMYKNKFREPDAEEGFDSIVRVNFVPKFSEADDEGLYRMYLMES